MPERDLQRAQAMLRRLKGATAALVGGRAAFTLHSGAERMFLRAMRESFAHHFVHCPLYREHCRQQSFVPSQLRSQNDLPQVPYLFVSVLKQYQLLTGPPEKVLLRLTSSGTGGQPSSIPLDGVSLRRIRKIVRHVYGALNMTDQRRTNYLCFTYDPAVAKDLGTAFSDELLTTLTRVQSVFYGIKPHSDGWQLDREGCLEALERFSKTRYPLRVLGFPAHAWDVLRECRGRGFNFGPLSYVLTGGGWKALQDQEIPRDEFRRNLSEWLGIPPQNVRDLYGMVEHGVPYTECEAGEKHIPRYSQVYVRDPATLELLGWGQEGLLHFLTPYLHSFPAISLLSTDLGSLERRCACGRRSPILRLTGRGGTHKHKGCAINALEVLA